MTEEELKAYGKDCYEWVDKYEDEINATGGWTEKYPIEGLLIAFMMREIRQLEEKVEALT